MERKGHRIRSAVEQFQLAHYQHRLLVNDQTDRRRRDHLDRVRAGIKESP